MTPLPRLEQERQSAGPASIWLVLLLASAGLTTVLGPDSGTLVQWNALGHAAIGVLSLWALPRYIYHHLRRNRGVRKPGMVLSGILASLLLLLLALSGLVMVISGRREDQSWVFSAHCCAALVLVGTILLHLLLDLWWRRGLPAHRIGKTSPRVLTGPPVRRALRSLGLYVALLLLLTVGHEWLRSKPASSPQATDYSYDYGEHPFRPSQTETTVAGHFVAPNFLATSRECGACHSAIYQQWAESLHGQAASDPAYIRNVSLLADNVGISATRYCEGCHAPVALLSGELSEGGVHGGIVGSPANHEGVGCIGCHGIVEPVHLQGVASYRWAPATHYLFAGRDETWARWLRQAAIRLLPQQHRQQMASATLADPKLCATCHEQFMDESMNDWGWVRMQTDYSHWLDSPYSGQGESRFAEAEAARCQDCHFPKVSADDPSADRRGYIRSHRSPGGNTAIPWLRGDTEQLDTTRRFLQAGRVLVGIDVAHRSDAPQTSLFVDEALRPGQRDVGRVFAYLGENTELRVSVSNRAVGHRFPGGTTDINEAWIHLRVTDASGAVIFESGAIGDDGVVDQQANIYESKPVDRQGRHVWRHDLFRMVGESYSNLIPAGATDIRSYDFTVPYWAKGPLTVTAVLRYRKFNQRYASWALEDGDIRLPIVDLSQEVLSLALRKRRPVENPAQTP